MEDVIRYEDFAIEDKSAVIVINKSLPARLKVTSRQKRKKIQKSNPFGLVVSRSSICTYM